jgi:glycosyltransferase involved in cell wall biosynthesis
MTRIPTASTRRRLVVIVVPDFAPTIGGTVRQATLQARGMQQLGYQVVVVTRRYDRGWPSRQEVDGLDVVRFGLPGRSGIAEKLSLLVLTWWFLRHRRLVAIVQTIMYSDYAAAAAVAGLRSRVAVVWAAHGEATDVLGPTAERLRAFQRRLRAACLGGCRHVALTVAIRDELVERGLPAASVAVVPVPVDTERFRPPTPSERAGVRADLGLTPDELVVVFTGRFVATKGVDRLIEAFAELRQTAPASRLLLVGGGSPEEEERVRSAAARWELGDSLVVSGIVTDVERYLWASDVFVLASVREGLSNSLVEAMATGLACIAGAEAGGDQVLYDGAGVIPRSSDVPDLARALVTLNRDPAARDRLARAAVERTRSFTPRRVAEQYEQLVLGAGA